MVWGWSRELSRGRVMDEIREGCHEADSDDGRCNQPVISFII